MSNNIVYREATIHVIKEMRELVHQALLSCNMDKDVCFQVAQAVEDTGMVAYREGFREGQEHAHN